jgi:hypothetical protein
MLVARVRAREWAPPLDVSDRNLDGATVVLEFAETTKPPRLARLSQPMATPYATVEFDSLPPSGRFTLTLRHPDQMSETGTLAAGRLENARDRCVDLAGHIIPLDRRPAKLPGY